MECDIRLYRFRKSLENIAMNKTEKDPGKPARAWNDLFDGPDYVFGTEPNDYLVSKRDYLKSGQKVLLVADGEGRNSVWCAQQGMDVDAFDLSVKAVEKAKKLAEEKGVTVHYFVSGIDDWDWESSKYDAVIVIFAQFATPSMRTRLFANCIRTLKQGGILILQGYTPKQLEFKTGGPPRIEHLYTETMLCDYFGTMDILELESYEAFISEGARHTGMSALTGMVARKTDK